ncbi:chromosomal replication initiator protein DnaA [Yunchengibacter salinarum]|uniref:chromosomal replication initiator protein DnaA n=1 Tax=Yunchengibacter salinarum TaxID=3133399 RepID=UPI0035B676D0
MRGLAESGAAARPETAGTAAGGSAHHQHPAWEKVCSRFRREFGEDAYSSWMGQLAFRGIDGGTAELTAPSRFVRDWVDRHYAGRLRDFFMGEDQRVKALSIRLASAGQGDGQDAPSMVAMAPGGAGAAPSDDGESADRHHADQNRGDRAHALDPRYSFDSFVVGKSNELAYAAAKRIAESDEVTFNPLFLHGGVGLGKTHLMHALAWEVTRRNPGKRVVYCSAEKFMYEFISALRYKDTHAFKQKYRNVDLLMVDDVQFISHKGSTQEEFFHTFNALVDSRRQVVISADRSPTDLEGIEDRIISRLGWGLVADIHPTDYELRFGILESKAERAADVTVPRDVLEFLARRITSNVRELEGALNRVMAYATLVGRPITIDMTRDVLQDLIRANDRKLTIDEIQRTVAEYYNLRLSELLSTRRARNIARPRQVAMYLAKQLTSRSLPDIGRRFGGRDHTTVMHAVRKVDDLRRDDSQLDEDITRLTRQLEG